MKWLNRIRWTPLILVALVLGLAPFFPEPHLWGKLKLLAAGELRRPIDIFDLLLHGAPILLLVAKVVHATTSRTPRER